MAHRVNMKIYPSFFDPFKIIDEVGAVAYKLELPNYSRMHDML